MQLFDHNRSYGYIQVLHDFPKTSNAMLVQHVTVQS